MNIHNRNSLAFAGARSTETTAITWHYTNLFATWIQSFYLVSFGHLLPKATHPSKVPKTRVSCEPKKSKPQPFIPFAYPPPSPFPSPPSVYDFISMKSVKMTVSNFPLSLGNLNQDGLKSPIGYEIAQDATMIITRPESNLKNHSVLNLNSEFAINRFRLRKKTSLKYKSYQNGMKLSKSKVME